MWDVGYIRGRTSRRKSDYLFLGRVFSACPVGTIAEAAASESRVLGVESNCQEIQERSTAQNAPKNTPIIHLSRKLVCLAKWLLADVEDARRNKLQTTSQSLWSATISKSTAVNTGDREKSEKENVVSCMWRETRNLWGSVIGLIALKYTTALAHTPRRMTRWKPNPPCRATAMGIRKPEKGE